MKVVARSLNKNKLLTGNEEVKNNLVGDQIANNITDSDPEKNGEAMRSNHKSGWMKSIYRRATTFGNQWSTKCC